MKYLDTCILILLSAFAAQSGAEGLKAEGVGQDGVAAEGLTYDGTGTVQDAAAAGDLKVIDVLKGDGGSEGKAEKPAKEPKIRTFNSP